MAGKDVTIRVSQLDDDWAVIGGDISRGVYPENVVLEADSWGSTRASFNLRRNPNAFFPDLGAFTPIDIEVGAQLVWSGRVAETPSQVQQRVINVQCEGWQYHLDDHLLSRIYVHTSMEGWKDYRTVPTADLAQFVSGYQVQTDAGAINITIPQGTTVAAFKDGGVIFDAGSAGAISRLSFDYDSNSWSTAASLFMRCFDNLASQGATSNVLSGFHTGMTGTTSVNCGPGRYVLLFVETNTHTATGDEVLRLKGLRLYGSAGYESGHNSNLKASQVITDAVGRATYLLSADLSGVAATTFSLPEYVTGGPITVRQAWTAVDAYHDWFKQVDVRRRVIYQPKPARPVFEVGAWSAIDQSDASANSGQDIYNVVLVTGQTPTGDPILTQRTSTGTVVSRRGFFRTMQLPVDSALPPNEAASIQIGDLWLAAHATTPFRGSLTLVGDQSLRHILSGRNVGLQELLINTGQLLRFSDRNDPDTGGHGHDGRIAGVTYMPASNTAQVTVDNSRTALPALLARLAVIQR